MENYLQIIRSSRLFFGISENEIKGMLGCLEARKENFGKDTYILRVGDTTDSIGILLSGTILVTQEDIWGNRNILSTVRPGETFAASYACAKGAILDVSVYAETAVSVIFLNVSKILSICPSSCEHHSRVIKNLLGELANKNLLLSEKLTHMAQRTTRAKLMSYFSAEAQRIGKYEFDIPFSRQQLADYLAVERSGLSLELGKMKNDGLLDFDRNHFILHIKEG